MHQVSRRALHCKENPIYVFLFWELPGLSPNVHIHVSVSDLYIPRIEPHISCSRIGRAMVGIYKSLTDTWMWNWDCGHAIPFLGIFVSNCRYWFFAVCCYVSSPNIYNAKEGLARIQYKSLVPIYVFSEMKLLFPKQNYNVLSPSSYTHISVRGLYTYFQHRSAYSAAGKYLDWSWEYMNRSQTHECGYWDWDRAIPRKGIHK